MAGNAHTGNNNTSGETVVKDIVAPTWAGKVTNTVSTQPGTANFFNNSGQKYYNNNTGNLTFVINSTTADPTINGETYYIIPFNGMSELSPLTYTDYDFTALGSTDIINVTIPSNTFKTNLTGLSINNTTDLKFSITGIDIAGNPSAQTFLQTDSETPVDFSFRYDITAPALTSITFTPDGDPTTYVKIGEDLDVTLTLTGNETGAALVTGTSNINGESVTEFDDFTFGTNTPGIIRYAVTEGDNFIANSAEIPFALNIRDIAGNIMTVQASDDVFEGAQPGIDATVPTYTLNTYTLTPETNSDVSTVGAFTSGNITASSSVVNLATTRIQTVLNLSAAAANLDGATLRVYPSYSATSGYNSYFTYTLMGTNNFDLNTLISDLSGPQDGEDGGDDFVWNSSANGDVNLFLKFRFVSVGGNVGAMFPTNGLGNFPVDIDRPTASSIDVVTSATGTNYGAFSLLTGQYTNADYVGHKVVFDEIVNITATGFFYTEYSYSGSDFLPT